MAETTKIEWTQSTWNPWHGCHKVSAGCKNCYMFREKKHYGQDPNNVVRSKTKFYDPLKWKEPRIIFTCSWSDFFIEEADPWRDEAFAIMALTPQHTYQVLTKRPDRMLEYLTDRTLCGRVAPIAGFTAGALRLPMEMAVAGQRLFVSLTEDYNRGGLFQLPNVWLGVSVEDQKTADERIPLLLNTPAAVRWLSIEPLLGPINIAKVPLDYDVFANYLTGRDFIGDGREIYDDGFPIQHNRIDWVVVGGESGPDARPMHPDWARSLRYQCTAARVPFFFKQWGEWWPISQTPDGWADKHPRYAKRSKVLQLDGDDIGLSFPPGAMTCFKVGKGVSGRLLDGREWNEMPDEAVTRPVGSVPHV